MGYVLYYNKKREYLKDMVKIKNRKESMRFLPDIADALVFFDRKQIVELIHEFVNPKTHMNWEIHPYGMNVEDGEVEHEGNRYQLAESNKQLFPGDQMIYIGMDGRPFEIVTVHHDQTPVTKNTGDPFFEFTMVVKPGSDEPVKVRRNHYRKFNTINGLSLLDHYGYRFRDEIVSGGKVYFVKFMYSLDKICATDADDKYSYKAFSKSEAIIK